MTKHLSFNGIGPSRITCCKSIVTNVSCTALRKRVTTFFTNNEFLKVDKNDAVGISATPPPLDRATSNSNSNREGIPSQRVVCERLLPEPKFADEVLIDAYIHSKR